MIDLRQKLPASLEVDGEFFAIKTDFRVWLRFQEAAIEDGIALTEIFDGLIPDGDEWVKAAVDFLNCETVTPKKQKNNGIPTVDFIRDGDYIVGSFWQVYGIDLTSIEYLHWHVFLALFRSLPSDCKIAEIMSYRNFNESEMKTKPETRYKKLKADWSLPVKTDKALEAWADAAFGATVQNIPNCEENVNP